MLVARAVVQECAREAGLDLVGVASVEPFNRGAAAALERLGQGLMGSLTWYTPERVARGVDPQRLLPGARSIIAAAAGYPSHDGGPSAEGLGAARPLGRVARYAWGRDYHGVLKTRLEMLARRLGERVGGSFQRRVYVDDGPLLEREVALRAGLGFFGKSTNIFTSSGSWVSLGQVVTDLEIEPDLPSRRSCGSCATCVAACPTGAIVAPYVLDSRRCIAYLTIENRGPIPREMRPTVGDWLFGCDVCQEVCPVNRVRARPPVLPRKDWGVGPGPALARLDPVEVLQMDGAEFRRRFRRSAVWRARLEGLQRNACVVLGNVGGPGSVPALAGALSLGHPLVRGHAAWALGRIGGRAARLALARSAGDETDPYVREEAETAIAGMTQAASSHPGHRPSGVYRA